MERLLYIFLPMSLLFRFYVNKKDKGFDLFIKYLSLCFINNVICALFNKFYFHNTKLFDDTIEFFLKYSLLSVVIGIIMTIVYKLFINFWKVKIEVVHEKENKKN